MNDIAIAIENLDGLSHEQLYALHKKLVAASRQLSEYHDRVRSRLTAHNEVGHARRAASKLSPQQRAALAAVLTQEQREQK